MSKMTKDKVQEAITNNGGSEAVVDNNKIIADIAKLINRWESDKKRPLYLYCIVSGKKCAMTAKALWEKRLKKCNDDLLCLFTTYVSRGARKTEEASDAVKTREFTQFKTRMPNGAYDWFWRHPNFKDPNEPTAIRSEYNVRKLHNEWVESSCGRPDISVEKKGCSDCPFVLVCRLRSRHFVSDKGRRTTKPSKTQLRDIMERGTTSEGRKYVQPLPHLSEELEAANVV